MMGDLLYDVIDETISQIPFGDDNYSMNEDTTTTGDYDESVCDKSMVRQFRKYYEPLLYWLIVVLGAVGNLMVIWIYAHFRNRLKTMTDVYLLNLAVADLLFLGTLPFWAVDAAQGWTFGTALCKVTFAVYKVNFFSSMLLLTCISVDRYFAIVETTKAQNSKRKRLLCSKLACVCVWLLAVVLSLPELLFAKSKVDYQDNHFCSMVYWNNEKNRTKILVLAIQISVGFCLPLLVMICCYTVIIRTLLRTRSFEKHKALRVILAVVAVFVLSQLPYNSMLVVEAAQATNLTMTDCGESMRFDIANQVMKSLAYTHSCLNPFLYAFVGVRFRRDIAKLLSSFRSHPSQGKISKVPGSSHRSFSMSETDTNQALSL